MTADFDEFASARAAALLRYAHVLTGDRARAEDLVQDALAGAYRHWARVGGEHAEAYVRRSILHAYRSNWRRFGRWERSSAALPDRTTPDHADMATERDAMRTALATLPPRMRAVLVLRFYEDMSEAQVAGALGISLGTVKSTTSKALAKLRAATAPSREAV